MRQLQLLACAVALGAAAGAVHAHHSQAGLFDPAETVEVTGVVKSVSWRNPHGHIIFTVTDEAGNPVDWDETAPVSVLRIRGLEVRPYPLLRLEARRYGPSV